MRKTGLKFTWEAGSKNSNAIRVLKRKNIAFEYDHFGNLTVDFYGIGIFEKVDFEQIQSNEFEICIAQPKRSALGRQPWDGLPALMIGRPERENMKDWTIEQLQDLWRGRGYTKKEAQAKAEKDFKEMHRKKSEAERHQIMQEMLYN